MSLRRLVLLVGVAVAVVVGAGAGARATEGARTTADEPHYLLSATSLWEDHDLDIADERAALRYLAYHEVALPLQAEVQDGGRQVAPHDPLLPLLLAVPVGLGGWLGGKVALAAVAGVLAGLLVWAGVRRFGARPRVAAVTVLVAGCSPPLAVYGTQVYPELVAGLVCLTGFLAVTTGAGATAAPRPLDRVPVAVVLVSVTALPWLSVKYLPVALVLTGALAWRLRAAPARLGVALGVVTVAALSFAAGHRMLYGGWTAYASGSHFADGELTVMGSSPDYLARTARVAGLLVDRSFGLVPWQPAALAVPLALGALVACRRRTPGGPGVVWVLVATVGAGWATATWVALTMHGWWWPGRQVVVVVPLAVLAVAWWADGLGRVAQLVLLGLGVSGVVSYALAAGGATAGWWTLVVDVERIDHPGRWLLGPVLPDLRADRGRDGVLLAAWAVLLVVGTVVAARQRSGPFGTSGHPVTRATLGERTPHDRTGCVTEPAA